MKLIKIRKIKILRKFYNFFVSGACMHSCPDGYTSAEIDIMCIREDDSEDYCLLCDASEEYYDYGENCMPPSNLFLFISLNYSNYYYSPMHGTFFFYSKVTPAKTATVFIQNTIGASFFGGGAQIRF